MSPSINTFRDSFNLEHEKRIRWTVTVSARCEACGQEMVVCATTDGGTAVACPQCRVSRYKGQKFDE